MNRIIIILVGFLITSCNDGYEKDEFKAIEDFANDYLKKNHLKQILEPRTFFGEEVANKPNIDSLDLKVYLSDALLPISQIKEDNEWMFNDNYFGTEDSATFYGIVNSEKFNQLEYREFDKNQIELIKPYRQFDKSQEKIKSDKKFSLLSFSRVCFDDKRENGIVVIEYKEGSQYGTMSGYHMALLIKKIGEKWVYVPRE